MPRHGYARAVPSRKDQHMSAFAPLRRAVIAGAVGTLAMDALWYQRYRRAGGSDSFIGWEFGGPAATFSEAGAPAQIGQALASRFDIQLPESSARLTNNVVHWATGVGWGIVHSVVRTVTPMATLASGVADRRRGVRLVLLTAPAVGDLQAAVRVRRRDAVARPQRPPGIRCCDGGNGRRTARAPQGSQGAADSLIFAARRAGRAAECGVHHKAPGGRLVNRA